MTGEYQENTTKGHFVMHSGDRRFSGHGLNKPTTEAINTFVFNKGNAQQVSIDGVWYTMPTQSILPLVSQQHFEFEKPETLVAWQFNREFYCIVDHDAEVGCVGFLFYGIHHPMFIQLDAEEVNAAAYLEPAFSRELVVRDQLQGEMLRSLLKRLIIKATRIAKQQCESYRLFPDEKMDLIRKYALLVEGHFKQQHEVSFYAAALNKAPKTLSNVFALLKQPSPSAVIRNRILLEAKRYLYYTDKSA